MREVIVKTSKVYEGRVVKLDVHEVRLPDDTFAKRELIRHMGAAAVLPLDTNGEVVMVRQFRLGADRVTLEIPAGILSEGEAPEACAQRELQEETGFAAQELVSLGAFYSAPGYTSEVIHVVLGTGLTPSPLAPDADEFLEVVRLPLSEALEMVTQGTIIDSKTIIALLKTARLYQL